MIYACEDCGFLFYRVGEVRGCPSCEGAHIRLATKEETERILPLLEQQKGNIHTKEE